LYRPLSPGSSGVADGRELTTLRRIERTLANIRWFGVAFALFQVAALNFARPRPPSGVVAAGFVLVGFVALGNAGIALVLPRLDDEARLRRLGVMAFAMDTAVLFAFVWLFSYDPNDTTWVLLYVLPLEGAIRYQMRGALWALALAAVSEAGREVYRVLTLDDYPFYIGSWTFRVGIDALIAFTAGFMSRSMERARMHAESRVDQLEELAERETEARRELGAFHVTVLAGVAAKDLDSALQSMVEQIGLTLGLDSLIISVIEGDLLRPAAVWGLPESARQVSLRRGEGITGQAWAQDRSILVPDVHASADYVEADPTVVEELAIPLRVGPEMLGVLDVESRTPGQLTPEVMDLMNRLGDQVALVMNNARALTRQREAIERLRELDEMKSDFVAITSHELRTPLTAIRGFVDTLRTHFDRFSPEERRHFLDIIDEQGRKLTRLLEDLLTVSRIEGGAMPVRPEDVSIEAILSDLKASFESQGERVHIRALQDGRARLDPHRTSQVLRNLVQNALKFSPKDAPVEVEASRANGEVRFRVTDRGIGIPADELDRIFERFHQAGDPLTREQEGAGLGLYISKRLVEAMGGRIEVDSTPGSGSAFLVSLPLDGGRGAPAPASPPPPAGAPSG
jgi:signal transduction histidine kinase